DGEFAHRFTSPSGHVDKRYLIRTDQPLFVEDAKKFSEGITLSDGTRLKSAKLEISENDPCQAEVTISEGKYHQIKRMIASCGKTVTYLKRLSMGDITLDPDLEEGEFKEL
ncbi:MAG: 16S rRNA pseudouridine(516) synthase, partial [Lachnospiraceae bacterium]|nr:16S rRNA pseudouridine(516) synthase [Lachnospiraceae bacterium]